MVAKYVLDRAQFGAKYICLTIWLFDHVVLISIWLLSNLCFLKHCYMYRKQYHLTD